MDAVDIGRTIDSAAKDVLQHRRAVLGVRDPAIGKLEGDFEDVTRDPEKGCDEIADARPVALLAELLPIDPISVFARPDSDVADLTDAEAAVDEMLVGVEKEVEEVVVRGHRGHGNAVMSRIGLGRDALKAEEIAESAQRIALEEIAVELDEDSVRASKAYLAVVGEGSFVGHEPAGLQEEAAVLELGGGDVEVLVAARAQLGVVVKSAADDALDDDGVESRIRHHGPELDEGGGRRDLRGNAAEELAAAVDSLGDERRRHRREDHVPKLVVVSQMQDPARVKFWRDFARVNRTIRQSRTQKNYEILFSSCQLRHSRAPSV